MTGLYIKSLYYQDASCQIIKDEMSKLVTISSQNASCKAIRT